MEPCDSCCCRTTGVWKSDCAPMYEWTPEEVKAHIVFQQTLNERWRSSVSWSTPRGWPAPDDARFVVSDGVSAPLVTDGPFPESKELLAGYRIVEVDSPERALTIAAQVSAAPGRAARRSASASRCARS